jgi:hypothetical protein
VLASAHRLRREGVPVELREQVLAICGPAADILLDGEPDPHAAVGGFDTTVQRLAVLPREQVDSIWRAARVVPGGLLDADGRAVAARELFDVRDRPGIRRVAAQASGLLAQIRALLRSRGDPALSRSVAARGNGTGWSALPAVSLALALAARLASRDQQRLRELQPLLVPHHAALARHAPRLVAVDLILAELLLSGAGT